METLGGLGLKQSLEIKIVKKFIKNQFFKNVGISLHRIGDYYVYHHCLKIGKIWEVLLEKRFEGNLDRWQGQGWGGLTPHGPELD